LPPGPIRLWKFSRNTFEPNSIQHFRAAFRFARSQSGVARTLGLCRSRGCLYGDNNCSAACPWSRRGLFHAALGFSYILHLFGAPRQRAMEFPRHLAQVLSASFFSHSSRLLSAFGRCFCRPSPATMRFRTGVSDWRCSSTRCFLSSCLFSAESATSRRSLWPRSCIPMRLRFSGSILCPVHCCILVSPPFCPSSSMSFLLECCWEKLGSP
jgi:hypothetical protein